MLASIITSLYRTEAHLPTFVERVQQVIASAADAGLSLEFIVIANDATQLERSLIDALAARYSNIRPIYVPLETVYASWNRGVREASGDAIGFWNVDDVRTVKGLLATTAAIRDGYALAHPSYEVIHSNGGHERRRVYHAPRYEADVHRIRMRCGPFFMFTPGLYTEVGPFDERFRVAGDFDWCARATDHVEFRPVDVIGGHFLLHGGNLSDGENPLLHVEDNVVHLKRKAWDNLRPVDPQLMRETWSKWSADYDLHEEIKEQLWGEGALERWQAYLVHKREQQRRQQLETRMRYLPKQAIDRLGLRPLLARLGVVKPRVTRS